MAVRSTMAALIAQVRLMINDTLPAGSGQIFTDQQVQDKLDEYRDDVRYELLEAAATIANTASTNNQPATIWADYYSRWKWWETDVALQGNDTTQSVGNNAWKVLTPAASDYIVGHWQFELTPLTNGTAPGQYPPVYATGKTYDLYAASADLLRMWAAQKALAYAFTAPGGGGQYQRQQMFQMLNALADTYDAQARPRVMRLVRDDTTMPAGPRGTTGADAAGDGMLPQVGGVNERAGSGGY